MCHKICSQFRPPTPLLASNFIPWRKTQQGTMHAIGKSWSMMPMVGSDFMTYWARVACTHGLGQPRPNHRYTSFKFGFRVRQELVHHKVNTMHRPRGIQRFRSARQVATTENTIDGDGTPRWCICLGGVYENPVILVYTTWPGQVVYIKSVGFLRILVYTTWAYTPRRLTNSPSFFYVSDRTAFRQYAAQGPPQTTSLHAPRERAREAARDVVRGDFEHGHLTAKPATCPCEPNMSSNLFFST